MRRHAISRVFLNCDKEKILNIVISWRHLSPFTCRKRDAHQLHVQSANQEERHGWVIKQLMFVVTPDISIALHSPSQGQPLVNSGGENMVVGPPRLNCLLYVVCARTDGALAPSIYPSESLSSWVGGQEAGWGRHGIIGIQ
jgi:hypothetical protein